MVGMWKFWSRKPNSASFAESAVSGVSIVFLQKRYESFTTVQLSQAMKRGWKREHDPGKFFATSVGDGEGAVLKLNQMFITMRFFNRRLDTSELGERELPEWAAHGAYCSVTYACRGGVPVREIRDQFYSLLGLLSAELIDENVVGLLFTEERVLIRNQSALVQELRSGVTINPTRLAATYL
jgi:hypothetical protein